MDTIPNILLEDESLELEQNKETGQLILKGLGDLHIEVVLNRVLSEFGIKVSIGKMFVSYKESPNGMASHKLTTDRMFKNKIGFFEIELEIERMEEEEEEEGVEDKDRGARKSEVVIDIWDHASRTHKAYKKYCAMEDQINVKKSKGGLFENQETKEEATAEHTFCNEMIDSLYSLKSMKFSDLLEIQKMLEELTERGPLINSQLVNSRIRVVGGRFNPDYLDQVTMKMTVTNCYLTASRSLSISLMEPICRVQVQAKREILNVITTEAVSKREGKMISVGAQLENNGYVIQRY